MAYMKVIQGVGQGGKNGVPEAVSTMNNGLWTKVKADYESKGYQVQLLMPSLEG